MANFIQGEQLRRLLFGTRVTKTGVSPINGSASLFTVTGGKVVVLGLVGEVTTAMSSTATSINVQYKKSGGTAVDVSAATVVTSDAIGTLYGVTGVAADLLSAQTVAGTEAPNVTFVQNLKYPIVVDAGDFELLGTAAQTGVTAWTLLYVPLDDGAAVAAS